MNLTNYCEKNGGSALRGCSVLAQVAADADCSHETLYMIAKGHKRAGSLLAGAIDKATRGEVSRYDLRPDVFGPAPAEAA
jgi:hypothetical protein